MANENLKFHTEIACRATNFISLKWSYRLLLLLLLLLLSLFIALAPYAHYYWFVHKIAYRSQYRNVLHYFEVWFVCSVNFELVPNWLNGYWSYLAYIQYIYIYWSRSREPSRSNLYRWTKWFRVNEREGERELERSKEKWIPIQHSQPNIYPFVCYISQCLSKRSTLICR